MNDYVTKAEFSEFKSEMFDFRKEIYEFRKEMNDFKLELKADFAAFKEEMRIMLFEALQAQTEMLKAYVDEKIEEVKREIRRDREYTDFFVKEVRQNEKENTNEHSGFSRRLKALEA